MRNGTIGPAIRGAALAASAAALAWAGPATAQNFSTPPMLLKPDHADTGFDDENTPDIATNGGLLWVTVFERQNDIYSSRSLDAGRHWATPRHVNTGGSTGDDGDLGPRVASDGQGNWVTAWWSQDDRGNTIGADMDILFARSTNGKSWSATQALNSDAATDDRRDESVALAADGAGNWIAAWSGGPEHAENDILFARSTDAGQTWSPTAALNTNAATDTGNDVAVQLAADAAGNWVAVWSSPDDLGGTIGSDGDILFATSSDGGASWSAPQALNTNAASDTGGDGSATIATDGAGVWVTVWSTSDTLGGLAGPTDSDLAVARSTDNGLTWSAPAPLAPDALTDTQLLEDGLDLETDGHGTWIVTWQAVPSVQAWLDSDYRILHSRSQDAGVTWTAPARLNLDTVPGAIRDAWPAIATNGQLAWVVVWRRLVIGGSNVDFDVHFVRSPRLVPSLGPPARALAALSLLALGSFSLQTLRRRAAPRTR